jgi:hypothetical protein
MADLPLLIAAIRLDTGNMNRDAVIQYLILDRLDKIHRCNHATWLARLLEGGFVGFANMSDQQLRQECAERGLDCDSRQESTHRPPDGDDEEELPDDAEHLLRGFGWIAPGAADRSS